ncbi:MAG: hypothetical protein JW809_07360, partial [Pirellulales bacterium]|nr:hypothetical protein [Pirellulales bacterium]
MLDRFGKGFLFLFVACVVLACAANVQATVLAHWLFDENGGTTVNDSSGNGYHGTIHYLGDSSANAGQYEGGSGWTVGGFNFGAYPLDNYTWDGGPVVETTLPIGELAGRSYTLEFVATHNTDHMDAWSPFFNTNLDCCYFFGKTYGQNTMHSNLGGQGGDYSVPVPMTDGNPHHMALVVDYVKKTSAMYFDHQLVNLRGNMGDIDMTVFNDNLLTLGGAKNWQTYERWDGFAFEARITVDEVLTPADFLAVPDPILPPAATGSTWEYTDFSDPSGLRFRGSAGPQFVDDLVTQTYRARLTSETLGGQTGQIWRNGPVRFANDLTFSTSFAFEITNLAGGTPADGMTFMIQDLGSNANGWGGGTLGIPEGGEYGSPTSNYVAVEMDTYPWGIHDDPGGVWPADHLAIDLSG